MKKSNEMSLGDAIKLFLKRNQLDEKMLEAEIISRWGELAGRTVNQHTQGLRLKDGILSVQINSAVLRKELIMHRSGILEKINLGLAGRGELRDIRFH